MADSREDDFAIASEEEIPRDLWLAGAESLYPFFHGASRDPIHIPLASFAVNQRHESVVRAVSEPCALIGRR
jgi:hypothetical protein